MVAMDRETVIAAIFCRIGKSPGGKTNFHFS